MKGLTQRMGNPKYGHLYGHQVWNKGPPHRLVNGSRTEFSVSVKYIGGRLCRIVWLWRTIGSYSQEM